MAVVGFGRDRAVLRTARSVPALGLHRSKESLAERLLGSKAVAVGDLVEPVLHRLRPELDGLEEDVVLGVAWHLVTLPLSASPSKLPRTAPRDIVDQIVTSPQ